jgi:hypothetical protein
MLDTGKVERSIQSAALNILCAVKLLDLLESKEYRKNQALNQFLRKMQQRMATISIIKNGRALHSKNSIEISNQQEQETWEIQECGRTKSLNRPRSLDHDDDNDQNGKMNFLLLTKPCN